MLDINAFADRLGEIMFDTGTTPYALSLKIGVDRSTISRYLSGRKMPALKNVIRIADYFQCSIDFLLGLVPDNGGGNFKPAAEFAKRLPRLLNECGINKYQLQKRTGIPESAIYNWQRGQFTPTVDNVIKIAAALDCSVDFVLGRGD